MPLMEKKTVEKQIHGRKITHPNALYNTLGLVWKLFVYPKYNVHYNFKTDFRNIDGPFFFISNHASRLDYIFVGAPLLPLRMNFVAGYNEFHRSHLSLVFNLLKVIPKKNFTPDIYTVKEISRVIRSGKGVCIFPEGMSSISGANQPVALGTGKLFKHHKVPVYYSVIRGGYLTSPKYNLRDRAGYVEVEYDQLFTVEELEQLTPEQIEEKINRAIYHDDYAWNKIHKHRYDIGENGAEDLEDLLFWCPRCGRQHTMATKGNTIFCKECGNGATLLDTYELVPFDDSCVIPETQTAWFNLERELIRKEVQDENFVLEEPVKLGMLPEYELLKNQATSQIVGEGMLRLDRSGLTYTGTKHGEPFTFHLNSKTLPTYGMCTDLSRFYTFLDGEFVEFYPEHRVVEKFFLATEELHRLNGGKWKAFTWETALK
ncbi:MAG: 1-acyl-sn-glycerol-3-phosphate acyltransferase [Ruminococcaceae bacterium]|nr:1-acyl-sn-glycerol-3-phosphate acyltransferase [Oscillospiraceae bacterium]